MDDLRIYSTALDDDTIKAIACGSQENPRFRTCDGLLGHWPFNGDTLDISSSRWHGTPNNSAIVENLFVSGPWPGEAALRLDGVDDLVQLPTRRFGGALSICADVKFDRFNSE